MLSECAIWRDAQEKSVIFLVCYLASSFMTFVCDQDVSERVYSYHFHVIRAN
jgi:hypothetical protein